MILAIDPGPERSAYVVYDGARVVEHAIAPNRDVLLVVGYRDLGATRLVVEMIASYGMAVGHEVFETCIWIGRFMERWMGPVERLVRRDVKMHLCGNNSAKDSNVRAALLDKFGPGKKKAVGTKANPGPLYGIKADEWAALALAVTFDETRAR